MAFWELSGESGKTLGADKVSLESLGIPDGNLRMGSLEIDRLSFSQVFDSTADVSGPELGQVVELWRDSNRFFKGHCTQRRTRDTVTGGLQIDTIISGPWWWMDQTPLSGDLNDQTGDSKERISFALDTGDLKAHITTLINRAITLGVPIAVGSIENCFHIPQITLKQMSCADAIAELLRWVPDCMAWIDYSPATPTFNMGRRSTASVETLTVGQEPCMSIDVNPRFELETDQVVVTYVKRATDGRTVYAEQISGHEGTAQAALALSIDLAADASASDDAYNGLEITIESGTGSGQTRTINDYDGTNKRATVDVAWTTNPDATSVYKVGNGNPGTGRRQIITVSGPELDSFLPNDLFDSVESDSADLDTQTGIRDLVYSLSQFSEAIDDGMPLTALAVPAATDIIYQWAQNTGDLPGSGGSSYNLVKTSYLNIDGSNFNPAGKQVFIGPTPPDWLKSQLGLVEIRLSGRWAYDFLQQSVVFGSSTTYSLPSWASHLPTNTSVYLGYTGSNSTNYETHRLFEGTWETTAWVADSIPSGTIYRDADYDFISPPAGLAEALQTTQSFQPYAGEIGIAEEELGVTRYRGKVINLNGALPEHATMKALVQAVDLDTATGRSSIILGTPQRLTYQGLVNRFRRTASDNIVYL